MMKYKDEHSVAYRDELVEKVADTIVRAWQARKPGKIGYGYDFVVIGFSRGPVYFDDVNALMTFKQEGRFAGTNSLQGRFVMPETGTGAAAYWPFPENKNAGMYGIRNRINSYSVTFLSDSWEAIGGNETTSTQLSGYFENCAFQYIEFNGKRYVAYTRQVEGNDGRLFVLEGAATDSWESIITARNVIYHAAIQNSFEGEGDVEPSPRSSTHNGMDLTAREIGGDVYIAVVKQNVGLSLFKMVAN